MGFLPARMTRLLVGGHRQHLPAAIDLLHAEGAVHLEDFQDPTGTTRIGSPLPAGAAASELLVKARGLLKALGAEGTAPAGPVEPSHTLAQAEAATTAIVDRANSHRADWVALESEENALAAYRGLDIELSALTGLTSVKPFIGLAREDPSAALRAAGINAEVQAVPSGAGFAVAALVAARDAAAAEKVLASAGFATGALPTGRTGTPEARLMAIEAEKSRLQSALDSSDADLARLRAEWGPRLASAERQLAAEVEKTQAPLKFGTTASTFHVEGWVPRSAANRVKNAIAAKFGDSLYVEDLGDVPRHEAAAAHGHGNHGGHGGAAFAADTHAAAPGEPHGTGHANQMPAAHAMDSAGHDGHGDAHSHGPEDEPPIHLDNPKAARPYEFLLGLLGKPRYGEIDPTKLMLVWFPLFFGLMVGDLAVGIIIALIGAWMRTNHIFGIGGPAVGRVLLVGGIAAAVVGALVFGEALGIHFVTPPPEPGEQADMSWEQILGLHLPDHGLIHKSGGHELLAGEGAAGDTILSGEPTPSDTPLHTAQEGTHEARPLWDLTPHTDVHLVVFGITFGFYSKIHDIAALLVWSLILGVVHLNLGFALGVRNVYKAHGAKLAIQEKLAWITLEIGLVMAIAGLVKGGWMLPVGGGLAVASLVLLWMGAQHVLGAGFVALLEVFGFVGNLLSYTRLAAIGASKAGMVIAFSAIGFTTLGGGNIHSPVGWLVYLLGFGLIIPLSILAGGLQSLRLQFVEFFQKFYTGGGRPYLPFGRRAA